VFQRPVDSLLSRWHTRDWWFELTNESAECNLNFLHASDRWFESTNESAEYNLNFLHASDGWFESTNERAECNLRTSAACTTVFRLCPRQKPSAREDRR